MPKVMPADTSTLAPSTKHAGQDKTISSRIDQTFQQQKGAQGEVDTAPKVQLSPRTMQRLDRHKVSMAGAEPEGEGLGLGQGQGMGQGMGMEEKWQGLGQGQGMGEQRGATLDEGGLNEAMRHPIEVMRDIFVSPERDYMVEEAEPTITEKEVVIPSKTFTIPERRVTVPERVITIPAKTMTVVMPEKKVVIPAKEVVIPAKRLVVPEKRFSVPDKVLVPEARVMVPDREVVARPHNIIFNEDKFAADSRMSLVSKMEHMLGFNLNEDTRDIGRGEVYEGRAENLGASATRDMGGPHLMQGQGQGQGQMGQTSGGAASWAGMGMGEGAGHHPQSHQPEAFNLSQGQSKSKF